MNLYDDNNTESYNSKVLPDIKTMENILQEESIIKINCEEIIPSNDHCGVKCNENIQHNVEIHGDTTKVGNTDKKIESPIIGSEEVACGNTDNATLIKSSNIDGEEVRDIGGNTDNVILIKCSDIDGEEVRDIGGNTDNVILIKSSNIDGDEVRDIGGNTDNVTLHQACTQGDYDLVKSILNSPNVDVNMVDKEGWSCLHETCIHSCQFTRIAQLLLQNGANPNIRDKNSETPLHGAVMYHLIENVKLLFNYKADFDVCNNKGISPLSIAQFVKDSEILTIFDVPLLAERTVKKASRYGSRKKLKKNKNVRTIIYNPSPLLSPSILKKRKRMSDENVEEPTPKKNISFSL